MSVVYFGVFVELLSPFYIVVRVYLVNVVIIACLGLSCIGGIDWQEEATFLVGQKHGGS
jgi:TRAP-type C4-dicarboxylate transport system permease small subunit